MERVTLGFKSGATLTIGVPDGKEFVRNYLCGQDKHTGDVKINHLFSHPSGIMIMISELTFAIHEGVPHSVASAAQ